MHGRHASCVSVASLGGGAVSSNHEDYARGGQNEAKQKQAAAEQAAAEQRRSRLPVTPGDAACSTRTIFSLLRARTVPTP